MGGNAMESNGEYTFFYAKANESHELGTGFFVHKRIISAVKKVEIVRDRMSYIILTSHWYHTIVLKVRGPAKNKIDYVRMVCTRDGNVYLKNYQNIK
jgi:hypothetical protein